MVDDGIDRREPIPGRTDAGIAHFHTGSISDESLPVLLLGGYGEPPFAWELSGIVDALAADGTGVIWYAARGVAPSAVPPLPWTMADLVDDVVALLDDLDVERATLVGYSLGGFTAELVARTHPDRVAGVVLMGAAGVPSTTARALSAAEVELAAAGGIPTSFAKLATLLTSLASTELCDEALVADWWAMLDALPQVWSSPDGEHGQAQACFEWIHELQGRTGPLASRRPGRPSRVRV